MKRVPSYVRVSKAEYREIRKTVDLTARMFGFDFHESWDLMIEQIEGRHTRVMAGKAKTEITLLLAAEAMRKQLAKERGRRDAVSQVDAIVGSAE